MTCPKLGPSSFIRELIMWFGYIDYVALFEIVDSNTVVIGATRHQPEGDYH
ncbi:MAG: plasmid stabilization protein [Rhodoferax sp.]|nr:plasmid stabilization protein [Rhodoferax sp.]